jgi:outer membrane protein OmpA-like peptidoglycan-associated protein
MTSTLLRKAPLAAAVALCATASLLSGCLTQRARPPASAAVSEVRAARAQPAPTACAAISQGPILVGFGFGEAVITDYQQPALASIVAWAGCNPAAPIIIDGAADGHGTAAEQQVLSANRAKAVAAYLATHGVHNSTVVAAAGAPEPDGPHMLVQAWGRRW